MRIIGSIDNAVIWNSTYHLIITQDEILKFKIMDSEEKLLDLYDTQMENPKRFIPVEGEISNYNITREEVQNIIQENLMRGKEIEENLDKIMEDKPNYLEIILNSSIEAVTLSNGTAVTLPHVEFKLTRGHLKFHLNHSNHQGRGKLPEDVFAKYEDALKEAFGEKLNVKNN